MTIETILIKYVEQGAEKARDGVKGLGKESDNTSKAILGIAKGAAGFAVVATAALAAVPALAAMGDAAATIGDEIGKTAKALNITAEELQELRIVAGDNGIAVADLEKTFVKFTQKLADAGDEASVTAGWLDKLNISTTNANGSTKSAKDLYFEAGRAIADMGSETDRSAASMDLYGKSGYQLLEMFRQTEDNIALTIETAREYGAVLSNELVAGAEAYRSKLDLIQQGTEALAVQRGLALAPLTVEWELMKNGIANASISLFTFIGLLDVPVAKAKSRMLELTEEMANFNTTANAGSLKDGANIGGTRSNSRLEVLKSEYRELAEIVKESVLAQKKAEAKAEKSALDAAIASDEERARLTKELAEDEQERIDASNQLRLDREAEAAARLLVQTAESEEKLAEAKKQAEEKAADTKKTSDLEAAQANQKRMITQIEQLKISAMTDENNRLVAQTAFEVAQYEIQNTAALNHVTTRQQAEQDFIDFKRLKNIELAEELGELSRKNTAEELAAIEQKHGATLNYVNTAGTAFSEYVTATGEGSDEQRDQIINNLKAMIIQALLFKAIAGLSGGALQVGSSGNLGFSSQPSHLTPRIPLARGGVVNGKSDVGSNNTMAEQGPEAIMPLRRDSNGNLGVVSAGGSGTVVNNMQTVNVTTNSDNPSEVADAVVKAIIKAEVRNTISAEQRSGGLLGR